jgi:uncharacterized membrane protein
MAGSMGLRLFAVLVGGIAILAIVGLIILWPDGSSEVELGAGPSGETEKGKVESVEARECPPPAVGTCVSGEVLIESGDESGKLVPVEFSAGGPAPEFAVGDRVRITRADFGPDGTYSVVDFERRAPMIWLAIFFALLVLIFGRLRGALSLLGLAISLAVVLVFIVPAILDGRPPLAVAIVGSIAVMLVTILLAHGTGPKSMAAILGTVGSLTLVGILAVLFTNLANLTGFSSEQAALLATNEAGISIKGLLIAGMVIGALGVLDDVTVSQSSTVMALKAANPDLGFRQLYLRAIEVGRDHVSATVNTLVLAYVGSSLPVLLIFGATDLGVASTVNLELVAKEIVATLVGSIGIIAAVPLTTALAALLAGSLGREELESASAGAHHH